MPRLAQLRIYYLPAALAALLFGYFARIAWYGADVDAMAALGYQRVSHGQLFPANQAAPVYQETIEWVPSLGINLTFLYDGLSLMFALLVSGIGALIMIYAAGYMRGHAKIGRFLAYMTAFMASMLGLVISGDVITLFVFWELTTITSFLLISFNNTSLLSRRAAVQALLITGIGGLALLVGLLWLGIIGKSWEIAVLQGRLGESFISHPQYLPVLILFLIGAFTKSAQVPFNVWLPNAMQAPTPVSAYLHSATMVKAGVFLLLRFNPILSGSDVWSGTLVLFGAATFLTGVVLAIAQRDLKLVLAQTTVASLGLMVMLIGVGTETAIAAAVLYLLAHALFKGALFMVVGAIDHETATRDVTLLYNLRRVMPVTALIALAAGLSMAGLPPFIGFVAKEVIYVAATELFAQPVTATIITATLVAGNIMMLVAGVLVAAYPFLAQRQDEGALASHPQVHDPYWQLLLGPAVLALCGLLFGVFVGEVDGSVVGAAVGATMPASRPPNWYLIPHLDAALALSVVTVVLGIYLGYRASILRGWIAQRLLYRLSPDVMYDFKVSALTRFAGKVTHTVQSGDMREYLAWTFFIFALAMLLMIWPAYGSLLRADFTNVNFGELVLFVIMVASAVMVVTSHTRMSAITSLGLLGFSVAIVFMLLGAPDLSFTQFMVETLQVVIMAFVLPFLHLGRESRRNTADITRDTIIAVAFGVAVTWVLIAAVETEPNRALPSFFGAESYIAAHGRNVVNVILVDFRALDTLGEIGVVMLTGMAITALLLGLRASRPSAGSQDDAAGALHKQSDGGTDRGSANNQQVEGAQ